MLDVEKILEKIAIVAPVQFREMMQKKKYCAAKWLFYDCLVTAVFIELDDVTMEGLFGQQGVFEPELVKKAYEKAGGGIDRATENYVEDERKCSNVRFPYHKE